MTPDQLPSLPSLSVGERARTLIAQLVSEGLEKVARYGSGNSGGGAITELKTFFDACNTAIASFLDAALPTVSTRVRTNSTTATITFNEALAASTSVPLSAFTIGARVLSAVVVTGSTVVITGVAITAGDIVTYTPPTGVNASLGIKDDAGNLAATFTGALA